MKRFSTALLLATVASCAFASAAQAQTVIPGNPGQNATTGNDASGGTFALLGSGATSVQNVLVQEMNCIGGFNPLGKQDNTTTVIAEPTALSTPAGAFNCATTELQPNFEGEYVATGSGFGRQAWRSLTNQFSTVVGVSPNNPFGTWNHVQFAFADSSITQGDLLTYNTTNNVDSIGGLPIMFPKYVLPVAVAYNPVYGKNASNVDMTFNNRNPETIGTTGVGGIRMSREVYCGIFNGAIKNWNDSRITALNASATLQDTTNDTAARWATDGVPIRLVGRLDKSGTTDIFTRALSSQCGGFSFANNYTQNAETLPYSKGVAGTPDFSAVRPDTGLRASGTDPVAGSTNMVSNEYFNGTAITNALVTGGGSTSLPTGNVGSGLFLVADGSGKVRDAINLAPDYTLGAVKLNGKVGYISADFIANSVTGSPTLFTAALRLNRTAGQFRLPTAANATAAVNSIRPPESTIATVSNGVWTDTDDRTVRDPISGTVIADRANPLAWYDVLYATSTSQANTLGDPGAGYPIVGTTQFLGYTCYTSTNRPFVANFLGWNMDVVTRDSTNANRTGIFTNATTGLLALSNIGLLPNGWQHAVAETFLRNSTEVSPVTSATLGSLNLWIQDAPTPAGLPNTSANGCGSGATAKTGM